MSDFPILFFFLNAPIALMDAANGNLWLAMGHALMAAVPVLLLIFREAREECDKARLALFYRTFRLNYSGHLEPATFRETLSYIRTELKRACG